LDKLVKTFQMDAAYKMYIVFVLYQHFEISLLL